MLYFTFNILIANMIKYNIYYISIQNFLLRIIKMKLHNIMHIMIDILQISFATHGTCIHTQYTICYNIR